MITFVALPMSLAGNLISFSISLVEVIFSLGPVEFGWDNNSMSNVTVASSVEANASSIIVLYDWYI